MILLIDLCYKKNSLSMLEFVKPIERLLKKKEKNFILRHFLEVNNQDLRITDKVIICGTSLKDVDYLKFQRRFDWIKLFNKPILGIGSGMQIISKVFEGIYEKIFEIGMIKIQVVSNDKLFSGEKNFEAYSLHNFLIKPNNRIFNILAVSEKSIQAIKHKTKYIFGILFHPEVRNEWIIQNYLEI